MKLISKFNHFTRENGSLEGFSRYPSIYFVKHKCKGYYVWKGEDLKIVYI